jgi:sterol 3beta-glucosyltransferase
MSVVVHHGGAGTTAAALRAGVPSVVVPFGNDQFAWGARVHELGVGSSPVPRKRLTSTRLAEAIDFCRDEAVRARASALALRIRRERGAELAADAVIQAIRSYVADHDPPLTTV